MATDYIQISIEVGSTEDSDLLVARLADWGFEGFEESDTILKAFVPYFQWTRESLEKILNEEGIKHSKSIIKERNWNAEWEAGYSPVDVDDFCLIRAGFHEGNPNMKFDIVINPEMSFGTGHHATTWLMVQTMRNMQHQGLSVLDFGTGTGILAILAEKMGAKKVVAVDFDPRCIENSRENLEHNACTRIWLVEADKVGRDDRFDLILANINKHVILTNLPAIAKALEPGGHAVLSGFLEADIEDILLAANGLNLKPATRMVKDGWAAISLSCS